MTRPTIAVARPRLPSAAHIAPYLAEIDANGWYSNFGPLSSRFQARLAMHWGLAKPEVALVASGTVAITLALLASGARPGSRCLMPSWTFAASAGAVHAAGLVPYFMDVDPNTWALDPAAATVLASRLEVGAILAVAPFGAPLTLDAWDAVHQATGVPVVIDAAAGFDALREDGPMVAGNAPVIVSLHATKVFGIGEGGAVLCRDPAWLDRIRRLSNFGFCGTREAALPGCNGKMSEYAAAVGLAALDTWRATRARWASVTGQYRHVLQRAHLCAVPGFGQGWVSSTLPVLWPGDGAQAADDLAGPGIGTLRWWGPGCHAQPAFKHCPREPLPVTEALARSCIGLPFWQDLTPTQIDLVSSAVGACGPAWASAARLALVPA